VPANNSSALRRNLLRWYEKNKRDLPWRKSRDPYAIWIAETMLQQTQVKTVLPYYERFLAAFPTLDTLARSRRELILRLWSGLGYYRRAENLRRAARQLVGHSLREIPRTYDALRALPGIGDYTAGAILSIAFQQRYPAVDGNVRRVLGRYFDLTDLREVRAHAARLLPPSRPGDFNQALMELGATLCTPREPECAACPLRSGCAARRRVGRIEPSRTRGTSGFQNVVWPLAVVRRHGKILLRRRAANGLLAGLWELPGGEIVKREGSRAALRRQLHLSNGQLPTPRRIGELRHSITHRRIRAPVYVLDYPSATSIRLPGSNWRWAARSRLAAFPMSSMTRKALHILELHEKNFS
jgi:A/G-specific adenine glycosylase